MYNKRTAIPTPRDIAVRHTLSRLRQRYGISATPGDYDVLLGRVESAVDQLSQGRNARHLKTNIVFDVEFPGPVVRVVYDRVEGQIKTALPLENKEAFAELTTVNATSFVSQFESDMTSPPVSAPENKGRQFSASLSLMAALTSNISELSIHQVQADLAEIRGSLLVLMETWGVLERSLKNQGVDIETWKPRTQEHRGLRGVVNACRYRLAELEEAERDFLIRQAENERFWRHLGASRKLAEDVVSAGRAQGGSGISFLRMPGDEEFGLYSVVAEGVWIGFVIKRDGSWYFLSVPEDGGRPKKLGRCSTRKEAATRLIERVNGQLEVAS